jgi:hypothetical protein
MVHALKEIRRSLVRDGVLVDLRPLADHTRVEVSSSRETLQVGHVTQAPEDLANDEAANRAIAEAVQQGWFTRERQESFLFSYYWDSPSEMQEYVEEEWADFLTIDEELWRKVRSKWAVADGDARLRLPLKLVIARYRKHGI